MFLVISLRWHWYIENNNNCKIVGTEPILTPLTHIYEPAHFPNWFSYNKKWRSETSLNLFSVAIDLCHFYINLHGFYMIFVQHSICFSGAVVIVIVWCLIYIYLCNQCQSYSCEVYSINIYNVREYRRGNQQWTIQRNWQHRLPKPTTNKKNRTQYVYLDTTMHKQNTNNVNKTWAPL